jgi:hypothetical protein
MAQEVEHAVPTAKNILSLESGSYVGETVKRRQCEGSVIPPRNSLSRGKTLRKWNLSIDPSRVA